MAKKNRPKSATSGIKSGRIVQLDFEYPIYEDAQKLINAFKNGCDESSLYYLTNCFRGFSRKMQRRMVVSLLDEYCGRIDGKTRFTSTGVDHVDRLLLDVIDKIDHDTKNLQYNER